jgi:amino acid transporter
MCGPEGCQIGPAPGPGFDQATALAITDMVGIGPFITIPLFLYTMGGPQAMIGWLLGAFLAFCDGLVWCELGAAMPKAGGSYHYLRQAYGPGELGRWFSFLIVEHIIFSAPLSVASGSIGFANYYCRFLAPQISPWGARILAAPIPIILILLLYRGIRTLGKLSVILLAGVLVGCFWIVGVGLPHLSLARLLDFPPNAFRLNQIFWAGLQRSMRFMITSVITTFVILGGKFGSLVATRVLMQYLPQAIGLFVLRCRAPGIQRPFRMWLYPVPGVISILGWLYILGTSDIKSLLFALAVLGIGSLVFFIRARLRHEWPWTKPSGN